MIDSNVYVSNVPNLSQPVPTCRGQMNRQVNEQKEYQMVFSIDNVIDKSKTMQQHVVLSMRAGRTHAHVIRPAR